MPKRILQGTVVSDKADKTVIVRVERRIMHPVYKKFINTSKKFAAHRRLPLRPRRQTLTVEHEHPRIPSLSS